MAYIDDLDNSLVQIGVIINSIYKQMLDKTVKDFKSDIEIWRKIGVATETTKNLVNELKTLAVNVK